MCQPYENAFKHQQTLYKTTNKSPKVVFFEKVKTKEDNLIPQNIQFINSKIFSIFVHINRTQSTTLKTHVGGISGLNLDY